MHGALEDLLDRDRRSLCSGPADAGSGIAALAAERWGALMKLMAGCRIANEINGHIIHVRQRQVRQLIDIVRGGAATTYDSRGKTFAKALRAPARA
ncbi:MAG: flagellar export chaperone FlgN [Steroidobacteraceae bacterium]